MEERERELLTGLGNCYETCREDYGRTVEMVAHARGLTPDEVRERVRSIAARYRDDPEFRRLRARLPEEFPF